MRTVRLLFAADIRGMRRWFATDPVAKSAVVLGFFLMFAGIAFLVRTVSLEYFRMLYSFEAYGAMTASYVFHASLIVLLWIGIAASTAGGIGSILTDTRNLRFLLPLPIRPVHVAAAGIIRSFFGNVILLSVVYLPVILSYGTFFAPNVGFFIRAVSALLFVAFATVSIGEMLALVLIRIFRKARTMFMIGGFFLFLGGMALLLRIIFPSVMAKLYAAPLEEFTVLFSSLPLVRWPIPTHIILEYVMQGTLVSGVFLVLGTLGIGMLVRGCIGALFTPGFLDAADATGRRMFRFPTPPFASVRYPLVLKDFLSVLRVPSESGYIAFLSSIAGFFFLMLSIGVSRTTGELRWQSQILSFALAWLLFFHIAFVLRSVFPLMAREAGAAWFLFTMPLSRTKPLYAKYVLGVISALPGFILSGATMALLPYAWAVKLPYLWTAIWGVLVLSVVHVGLGAIRPNWASGNDPEKVTTSLQGLAASGLSFGFAGLAMWSISSAWDWGAHAFLMGGMGIAAMCMSYGVSKNSAKRYEF